VRAIKLFGKTPERVAETYTWLAIDPSAEGITGKAFRDRKEFAITGDAADDAIAAKIVAATERLVGVDPL
jgi:hypothetical protein